MKKFIKTAIALICVLFLLFIFLNQFPNKQLTIIIIDGTSMEPTLADGSCVLADQRPHTDKKLRRGELVTVQIPDRLVVKRVVGLPGDTLVYKKGNIIIRNRLNPTGLPLEEPYTKKADDDLVFETTLSDKEYFVLGDNRDVSFDSRIYGPIQKDQIMATIWFQFCSANNWGLISVPYYTKESP